MKFLSVLALAAAVSAAAVAPRDDWNSWGCSTATSTKTVTATSTVSKTVTATVTATKTATVTAACSSGWNGWQ